MHLGLQRLLPIRPDQAWRLLTDPTLMNLWSEAEIAMLAPGATDAAWSVGTLREVKRPLGRLGALRLEEVVVTSEACSLFVYRALPRGPLREHQGEISFTAEGAGTRISWQIEARFAPPPFAVLAERALRRGLERSLNRLVGLCQRDMRLPSGLLAPLEDLADDQDTLWVDAMAALDEQRLLAERLRAQASPLQHFCRAYAESIDAKMRALSSGAFAHPGFVLRNICALHGYFIDNFRAYTRESRASVEPHWQRAFDAMHEAWGSRRARATRAPFRAALTAMACGARAQIDEDLPRALARVHAAHYSHVARYGRFRADFIALRPLWREAIERLLSEEKPWHVAFGPLANLTAAHDAAFERGERIAGLLSDTVADAGRPDGGRSRPSERTRGAADQRPKDIRPRTAPAGS